MYDVIVVYCYYIFMCIFMYRYVHQTSLRNPKVGAMVPARVKQY